MGNLTKEQLARALDKFNDALRRRTFGAELEVDGHRFIVRGFKSQQDANDAVMEQVQRVLGK